MAGPRMNRNLKIVLIVLASLLAVGIAGGAIMAGVIESERSAANRKTGSTARPTAVASLQVVKPTGAAATAIPAPALTPTSVPSLPAPAPTAYAPEVIQTVQAPLPPAPPPSQPAAHSCPSGVVAGGLTEISVAPAPEYGTGYVSISGRGVIHNATDAQVSFFDGFIPEVQGLDARGTVGTLMTMGEFDYVPPAGQPRPPTLTLKPGESMGYTVHSPREYALTVAKVKSFYSAMDRYDIYFSSWSNHRDCGNPASANLPGGQSLPNTYRPAG